VAEVIVGVLVKVGITVAMDGRGETVGVGVNVKTGSRRTVGVAVGVGVRYRSYVPHRLLPQAERSIPVRISRMTAL
jgi:uncharacterized alkaline shock family protein YloU